MHAVYLVKLRWVELGGFRVAGRPWLLGGWPEGMRALERAAARALERLASVPHTRLLENPGTDELVLEPPLIGEREGWIDAHCVQETEERSLIVIRALFPLRFWPLGAWVVFAAFRRRPEGVEGVSDEELDGMW